jgi:hypothetical protein
LRGRDIKKYSYEFADLYVILAHFGSYKTIPTEYPAIYKHLKKHEVELKRRGQCRYTSSGKPNLKNLEYPGQHHWLELDNNLTLEKLDDFSKQKIVYPNMTKYMPFILDNEGYFTNQKCFILTGENLSYLVAFFNSNLFKICYRENFPELQGGTRELSKIFFQKLKIPIFNNIISEDFESLITAAKEGSSNANLELEKKMIDAFGLQEYQKYIMEYQL